jgi:release factor glutamine methyltransferase
LEREVRDFEPPIALNGGEDGLDFHRKIIFESPDYLQGEGWLLLEVGQGQAEEVSGIVERAGRFHPVERIQDLSGIERVVRARKK